MDNESRRWWGGMIMVAGIATPIIALAVYINVCRVRRCSGTVSAPCIFVSPTCDLDFTAVWLGSSIVALAMIAVGIVMGDAARADMRRECARCGHRKTAHIVAEPSCSVPDCACSAFTDRVESSDD